MATRIIKNYTAEDLSLTDLGAVIPANGALEIGGDESRLLELASSEGLLAALGSGVDKFQVNDGSTDLSYSQGIELIRKIQRPTEIDPLGRWVVRSDSRKVAWDIVFTSTGDSATTIGEGTHITWDMSALPEDLRWYNESAPVGYKRQVIDWKFNDYIFMKEGTLYYYNTPKGTILNFYLLSPPNYGVEHKTHDEDLNIVKTIVPTLDKYKMLTRWVVNYHIEGNADMGDELNTESASEYAADPNFIWRCVIDVPEVDGWQQAHGHISLELYRVSQGLEGPVDMDPPKMTLW